MHVVKCNIKRLSTMSDVQRIHLEVPNPKRVLITEDLNLLHIGKVHHYR